MAESVILFCFDKIRNLLKRRLNKFKIWIVTIFELAVDNYKIFFEIYMGLQFI